MQEKSENPHPAEGSIKKQPFFKRKIFLISMLSLVVVAAACLIFIVPVFYSRAEQDVIIKIPANADKKNVGDSLTKYLGKSYSSLVMRASTFNRTDYSERHGAYKISKGMSPFRAERKLSKGAQQPVKITVNSFRTPGILAEKLAAKLDFTPDSLLKAMRDPAILETYGIKPEEAMVLFPDATYEVYWNASPEEVINKTGAFYKQIWNETRKQKAARLGLTPAEIVTLCSIVDEETNKTDEKGKIGSLYLNRLRKGMKLQADPTVKYAVGDFTLRRIKNEHLKKDSPYNTYQVSGLPPGPIRTTSVQTIDSILDSPRTEYLYMCAKDDFSGYHSFASSYSEHLKNARLYQRALNKRGIK